MLKATGPGPKVPCHEDANPLTDKDKSCATVDSCCLLAATVWISPPSLHSTSLPIPIQGGRRHGMPTVQ